VDSLRRQPELLHDLKKETQHQAVLP
jgi:hypothetical protein